MSKVQVSGRVDEEIAERAKDAVFWTAGLTLSQLIEEALEREIARREKRRGEPFPERSGEIPKGSPVRKRRT